MKGKVCIVGLGWLGLPLYHMLEAHGWEVAGTKRNEADAESLKSRGVHAIPLKLDGEAMPESVEGFGGDFLIINIPPGRRDPNVLERYPKQVQQLHELAEINTVRNIIFVSSTSVFGDVRGEVHDHTKLSPSTDSGRALVECEQLVTNAGGAVVRFSGLYGPGRHPGRFFAGRTGVPDGDVRVNFIHQDDAVGVIEHVMYHFEPGLRINASAPAHPPKKDFYHRAALDLILEPPQFLPGGNEGKIIRCDWLERTDYSFQHPDLDFAGCGGKTD